MSMATKPAPTRITLTIEDSDRDQASAVRRLRGLLKRLLRTHGYRVVRVESDEPAEHQPPRQKQAKPVTTSETARSFG